MDENSLNQAAAKLLIELIDCELQRLAFDANLWERFRAPRYGEKYQKRRARLMEARQTLAGMVNLAPAERL